METTSSKNNSMQNSVGNEENAYSVPYLNKTMISVTKEPGNTHITLSMKKSWKIPLRNSWLKRMYKMHSRNFKTLQIKNFRRHRNK
jgi:hypothetical protein